MMTYEFGAYWLPSNRRKLVAVNIGPMRALTCECCHAIAESVGAGSVRGGRSVGETFHRFFTYNTEFTGAKEGWGYEKD